jgi:hypothetical protein
MLEGVLMVAGVLGLLALVLLLLGFDKPSK